MSSLTFLEEFKYTCRRCGGRGRLPQYNHIQNGICFSCNGRGTYVNEAHKKECGSRADNWYHIDLGCVEFEFRAINFKQAETKMKEVIKIKRKLKKYEHMVWSKPTLNLGRKTVPNAHFVQFNP